MRRIVVHIMLGILAGLISGTLILGIGGRLMMRAMAIIGGLTGGFSWGGSLEVVILGALIGLCSGAFMGINYPFSFKNKVLWGLLHGLLAYLMILILPIDGKGAAQGFPDLQLTVHILFGGLFLLFGIGMAFLFHSLQAKWHKRREF